MRLPSITPDLEATPGYDVLAEFAPAEAPDPVTAPAGEPATSRGSIRRGLAPGTALWLGALALAGITVCAWALVQGFSWGLGRFVDVEFQDPLTAAAVMGGVALLTGLAAMLAAAAALGLLLAIPYAVRRRVRSRRAASHR